ncbi:MAG: Gfo/Idh/MocA family oxidoreductase, partial [Acidobacteriaceae bacterium]|nr:Gfo/Idh/MocA family oxidoreductase [Acidobacteriaceae bacterium]
MPSSNDNIQIALIGAGGMGQGDAHLATSIPGVKLIAASDCYDGRLQHMKEVYSPDTFTTRDYREILARPGIDAVIVATPDHWHRHISVDALNAGKHVYCEKP